MNKSEFLSSLEERLSGLPLEDAQKSIEYYSEIIDDRIEDGMSEDEAVEALGNIDEIVNQSIQEAPLTKIIKENVMPRRKLKTWETALVIACSPLWIPAAFAVGATISALYISLWSIIAVFYATVLVMGAVAVTSMVAAISFLISGDIALGLFLLGFGLLLIGIAILLFVEFTALAKGILHLSRKIGCAIKRLFIRKGEI